MGDQAAFDPSAWQFQAEHFYFAAKELRSAFVATKDAPSREGIAALVVAQFNMALAVELISKAHYLQAHGGPTDDIYTHNFLKLLPPEMLNQHEVELASFAQATVEWAGRYPTPKWTTEKSREKFDVPGTVATVDGSKIPNRASLEIVDALQELFLRIHADLQKRLGKAIDASIDRLMP